MKTFYEDFRYSYSIEKGENLTFPPHLHKHLELFYICDGEMAVTVSGNTLRLKAGEAALAFPNEIHSYYTQFPESACKCSPAKSREKRTASIDRITATAALPYSYGGKQ